MALNRRIPRLLKENKLRYVGIFLLIMLGSYSFVLAIGISQNLASLVNTFTEAHLQEDLSFRTDGPIPDVSVLETEANAVIEDYASLDVALSDSLTLRMMSELERVNTPAIVQGMELSGPGDILLDPAFANANGYALGSQIETAGIPFNVVGYVSLPHYIYPLKNVYDILYSPNEFGVGVISREAFDLLGEADRVYAVRFNDRSQSLNRQAVELRERLTEQGVIVSDWIDIMSNKRARMVWASITGMKTMSIPLPVAMFLLSCFIIGIMFWRMIRSESVIIGTLYAQGYRRRELTRHYMAIPLLLAIAGGLAGAVLALPSIKPSVLAMVAYYNVPVVSIERSLLNAIIAVLTPVVFLGLSSYLVIQKELKRPPAELMKGDEQKTKVNALERRFKLERLPFSTKFKLREQFRSISRLLFLLLGVMSASVLMVLGFTIMSSFSHVFSSDTSDIYRFEYEYAFRTLQYGEAPGDAEVFSGERFYLEDNEGVEIWVTGIPPDANLIRLQDDQGNALPNDQVNITKPLANRLRIKAGDSVSFISKESGKPAVFHIDAVADTAVEQFIFMPIHTFNQQLGYPENSYMGLFSTTALEIPDEELMGTKALSEVPSAMEEFFGMMVLTVVGMTLFASVVAVIILYLVTSLMIEENRVTISLFKVFGYRRREIRSLVLNSSTLVVVAGFLLSIPLAMASMGAIYGYLGSMINLVLPTVVNPWYVALCFVVIMMTYELSKWLCAKKLDAVSMSEALKQGTE
ncbi:MAG: ABC transporter permease [Bacillota bacterium]|nr:ABC transporter permease [Bacillota bacterium]MDW7677930.1 ABC transporter permease [Bacillota bacterium]